MKQWELLARMYCLMLIDIAFMGYHRVVIGPCPKPIFLGVHLLCECIETHTFFCDVLFDQEK